MRPAPLKALGQHYLHSASVIARIADTVLRLSPTNDRVLEIGPGPGALTEVLLARGLKVVALEIDPRMVEHLREKFSRPINSGQLALVEGDALQVDLAQLPPCGVVCGNLPYNVGTLIVFRFLEHYPPAQNFCFMLQKEVVLRFLSQGAEADYGLPTVKFSWAAEVLEHFWVKAGSFTPPPKVESGVFSFRRRAQPLANPLERGGNYDARGKLVAELFQHRRKMIRATFPGLRDEAVGAKRPQDLSPTELFELVGRPPLALRPGSR